MPLRLLVAPGCPSKKCSEYTFDKPNSDSWPKFVACSPRSYHRGMAYCILRTSKIKTLGNIAASLSHTFRDRQTDNADPARKGLNEPSDQRTAAEVLACIKARWPEKHRRDAVLCIEYLIAASPRYFEEGETGVAYFDAARRWLIDKHGAENVIFSMVHRDELTPHLVAYVVPIVAGRLNAKNFLGGKAKLTVMQTDFADAVGQRFGLERGIQGSRAKHTEVKQFYAAINAPPPPMPAVEVSTPPMFNRDQWVVTEGERLGKTLEVVLTDAARASQWGRFQAEARRAAEATAKLQTEKTATLRAEVRLLREETQRLDNVIGEWAAVFDDGLTDKQSAQLAAVADRIREANRQAAKQANPPQDQPGKDGLPAPGK